MRKVIGVGETVMDIIFRNNQPVSAKAGGSVYNALISLGRMGVKCEMITEVGRDKVGKMIKDFMVENGVSDEFVYEKFAGRTALSLAFLDDEMKADYMFYKDYHAQEMENLFPKIEEDDILLVGSFFALNKAVRETLVELLEEAKKKNAIIYYDINFRKNHLSEVNFLMPYILENYEFASIIKGSDEDFVNIYKCEDADTIYKEYIEFYSKNFIYTKGEKGARVFTKGLAKDYAGKKVDVVSTVGAGDNFNAGVVYGLIKEGITFAMLKDGLSEAQMDSVVKWGIEFSSEVCGTFDNYISKK